jgi:hypothetical protein
MSHPTLPGHEQEEFKLEDLFTLPILSTGLFRLDLPKGLTMKPAELYAEIR